MCVRALGRERERESQCLLPKATNTIIIIMAATVDVLQVVFILAIVAKAYFLCPASRTPRKTRFSPRLVESFGNITLMVLSYALQGGRQAMTLSSHCFIFSEEAEPMNKNVEYRLAVHLGHPSRI